MGICELGCRVYHSNMCCRECDEIKDCKTRCHEVKVEGECSLYIGEEDEE